MVIRAVDRERACKPFAKHRVCPSGSLGGAIASAQVWFGSEGREPRLSRARCCSLRRWSRSGSAFVAHSNSGWLVIRIRSNRSYALTASFVSAPAFCWPIGIRMQRLPRCRAGSRITISRSTEWPVKRAPCGSLSASTAPVISMAPVGSLETRARIRRATPYVGVGWGLTPRPGSRLYFSADLGVTYQRPSAGFSAHCGAALSASHVRAVAG